MKKLLTLLLALTIVFTMAVPAFAEPENFLTNPQWTKGTADTISYADGIATSTGFKAKYSAPDVDILPALKAAIGTDEEVEITIVFDARVNFKEGATENSTEAQMLIRGTSGVSGISPKEDPESWFEAYDEALDGEDRVFSLSNGNILKYLGGSFTITDEWETYAETYTFYATQINNPCVIKWRFTLDRFTTFDQFESLEIRNFQVLLAEDAEDIIPEKDEVIEDEKDEEPNAPAEDKPVATQKPQVQIPATDETPAPTPQATAAPDNSEVTDEVVTDNTSCNVDTNAILIVAGACAAVIIIACIVAVIVVKKKTSK